jgi:hypothetical protein
MEPALREGDYVLVRKCEFGALLDVLWSLLPFSGGGGDGGGDNSIDEGDNIVSNHPRTRERSKQQQQQQQRALDAMDRAGLVKQKMMAGVVRNAPALAGGRDGCGIQPVHLVGLTLLDALCVVRHTAHHLNNPSPGLAGRIERLETNRRSHPSPTALASCCFG